MINHGMNQKKIYIYRRLEDVLKTFTISSVCAFACLCIFHVNLQRKNFNDISN